MFAEFRIYPMERTQMSKERAKLIEILETTGLDFQLGPMATILEGDGEEVMKTIQKCLHEITRRHGRIITTIVIDDSQEQNLSLEEPEARVVQHQGQPVTA